jgi:hypothetical protein
MLKKNYSLFTIPYSLWILALGLLLGLSSCDYIEAPYTEKIDGGGEVTANQQNVLLLDFTGHTCKSCPKAHRTIDQLKTLYGDRVVPVAFHLGYFAKTQSGTKFTTDFRTPEGGLLEKYFEFVSFPIGTVQNISKEGLIQHGTWPSEVSAYMDGDAPIKLGIQTNYLQGLHAFTIQVDVKALAAVEGTLKMAAWVVQDSIIDWQKDEDLEDMDDPDYVHMHVFRTSFNGLWGETMNAVPGVAKDFTFAKELSVALKPEWKAEDCMVVVVVYREEDKRVMQVRSSEG